jgi:hypothetical protein
MIKELLERLIEQRKNLCLQDETALYDAVEYILKNQIKSEEFWLKITGQSKAHES